MSCVISASWSPVTMGHIAIHGPIKPAGADVVAASTTKGGRGSKKQPAAQAAAAAASLNTPSAGASANVPSIPVNEPHPRSGAFAFCYKEHSVYVLGGDASGSLDACFAITVSGSASPSHSEATGMSTSGKRSATTSPSKSKGDSARKGKGGSGAAAGTASEGGRNKGDCTRVVCSGKPPAPRKWFSACLGYSATSSSSIPLGDATPSVVWLHGGVGVAPDSATSSSDSGSSTTALPPGFDDLWELKLGATAFTWSYVPVRPPLPAKRYHHAMAAVRGRLCFFGGCDAKSGAVLGDFFVLEESTSGAAVGKNDAAATGGRRWNTAISAGVCYGGTLTGCDDTTVQMRRRPCARMQHSMAAGHGDLLFLFGGIDAYGTVLNDLWFTDIGVTALPHRAVECDETSLVVWRDVCMTVAPRAPLPLPKRVGATLLVAPVPKDTQDRSLRSSSSGATEYALYVCGGWDASRLSPLNGLSANPVDTMADSGLAIKASSVRLMLDERRGTSFRGNIKEPTVGGGGDATSTDAPLPMIIAVKVRIASLHADDERESSQITRSALVRQGSIAWMPRAADAESDGGDEESDPTATAALSASVRVLSPGMAALAASMTSSPSRFNTLLPSTRGVSCAHPDPVATVSCRATTLLNGLLKHSVTKACDAAVWAKRVYEDERRVAVDVHSGVALGHRLSEQRGAITVEPLLIAVSSLSQSRAVVSPSGGAGEANRSPRHASPSKQRAVVAPLSESILLAEVSTAPPTVAALPTPTPLLHVGHDAVGQPPPPLSSFPAALLFSREGIPMPSSFAAWCFRTVVPAPSTQRQSVASIGGSVQSTASNPPSAVRFYFFGGEMTPVVYRSDLWACELQASRSYNNPW